MKKPKFVINDDMATLVWGWHNLFHFFGSQILAAVLTYSIITVFILVLDLDWAIIIGILMGFSCAWVVGILWDVGDGFKPNWKKGVGKPWIIQQLFYSDGCSMQDIFVWDLYGSLSGSLLGVVAYQIINLYL